MPVNVKKTVRRREVKLADADTSRIVGELADDVATLADSIQALLIKTVNNQIYSEPFNLGLPYNPMGIIAIRITKTINPESSPVLTGGFVEWIWRLGPQGTFAEIVSIDGLTPSSTRYNFKFLIVGRADQESA